MADQHMESLLASLRKQQAPMSLQQQLQLQQQQHQQQHQLPMLANRQGPPAGQYRNNGSPATQQPPYAQQYGQPYPGGYPGYQSGTPVSPHGYGGTPSPMTTPHYGLGYFPGSNGSPEAHQRKTSGTVPATNLLDLLKFSVPRSSVPASPIGNDGPPGSAGSGKVTRAGSEQLGYATGYSNTPVHSQDLVAGLLEKATSPANGTSSRGGSRPTSYTRPMSDAATADLLNEVLGRTKPESVTVPDTAFDGSSEIRSDTPVAFGVSSGNIVKPDAQEPPKGAFTYVNPFDQLRATNPRNRAVKPARQQQEQYPTVSSLLGFYQPSPAPTPGNISPPFSPPPQQNIPNMASIIHEARHTPPITQPYVENINDPFAHEEDPLERETDSFEDGDDGSNVEDLVTSALGPNTAIAIVEERIETTVTKTRESTKSPAVPESTANGNGTAARVKVYNFPMKPFSQITVSGVTDLPTFGEDNFSNITRMVRTQDQLDRNLISASSKFIVYSLNKSKGGIRVIRQQDAKDTTFIMDNSDRVVHVQVGGDNRAMATGNSGAVLWVELTDEGAVNEAKVKFTLPPSPEQDQNQGLTKTRAHKSSCHDDVFAIGRGRYIHIINAQIAGSYAKNPENTEINEREYQVDHGRAIDTGKVSKDFCFSEDDTAILSVDKAGKLKLWDVKSLLKFQNSDGTDESDAMPPITEPLATFTAVSSGESYKASSVMFLDKARQNRKQTALRYVLVGLKQNHVLQLWDLAIGKPVQEVRFPQESQTDALCSIVYHAASGIIIVGNPTRNTISFIHLSSPRYSLPNITQTEFARAVAEKSPILPKIDATAIMSGLREYSFGSRGQLISLDILDCAPNQAEDDVPVDPETAPLFEIYVAHSKGMTCLTIRREDLGWDENNKPLVTMDAMKEGVITICPLPAIPDEVAKEEITVLAKKEAPVLKDTPRTILKAEVKPSTAAIRKRSPTRSANGMANTTEESVVEKQDDASSSAFKPPRNKKAKKDAVPPVILERPAPAPSTSTAQPVTSVTSETLAPAQLSPTKKKEKAKAAAAAAREQTPPPTGISQEQLELGIKRFQETVSVEMTQIIKDQMVEHRKNVKDERQLQAAQGNANQEAVLRMLQSTLMGGMEKMLNDLMTKTITDTIVPELQTSLGQNVQKSIPQAINATLPETLSKIMGSKEMKLHMTKIITDQVNRGITNTMAPALEKLTTDMSRLMTSEIHSKASDALKEAKKQHESDALKIAQLTSAVSELTSAFSIMERTVTGLLDQSKTLGGLIEREVLSREASRQQESPYNRQASPPPEVNREPTPEPPRPTEEELEIECIRSLLTEGQFEAAIVTWLSSRERQNDIFASLLFNYPPTSIIPELSVMVVLTVAASVTTDLSTLMEEKLTWLDVALDDLWHNQQDEMAKEKMPRILDVIVNRINQYYMATADEDEHDPRLVQLMRLRKKARELLTSVVRTAEWESGQQ